MARLNVLIYNGPGVCAFQQELLSQLKSYFSESYDCLLVSADCLLREPWEANCALLVMPGGQDLPYLKALYPEGTRRIQQYVASGGNYFGICAGAYFACKRIEFEVGRSGYEVTGSRPLCFFDGTARGSVSPGFVYGRETGAAAMRVAINGRTPSLYVNGGPYFDFAGQPTSSAVLGTYQEDGNPAIVECMYGTGKAILSGAHVEMSISYVDRMISECGDSEKHREDAIRLHAIAPDLRESEAERSSLFQSILSRFQLNINTASYDPPKQSVLWMAAADGDLNYVTKSLSNLTHTSGSSIMHMVDQNENWTFITGDYQSDPNLMGKFRMLIDERSPLVLCLHDSKQSLIVRFFKKQDLNIGFDIPRYFQHLKQFSTSEKDGFGKYLIYASVATSTQSLIDSYVPKYDLETQSLLPLWSKEVYFAPDNKQKGQGEAATTGFRRSAVFNFLCVCFMSTLLALCLYSICSR